MNLVLETRAQEDKTKVYVPDPTNPINAPAKDLPPQDKAPTLVVTPPIDENYWKYRVKLSDKQAIVGFPKFLTTGIGFAVEGDDWNTNLPYTCTATKIYNHIKHNKGDDSITEEDCLAAIKMIQEAALADEKPEVVDKRKERIKKEAEEEAQSS